jgi:hypothetical protein
MPTELEDVDDIIERTEGVSAAFLKELGRRAALVAAENSPATDPLVVRHDDLVAALDDLLEHSTPILRSTLGASPDQAADMFQGPSPAMFGGFHAMPGGAMGSAIFSTEVVDYGED